MAGLNFGEQVRGVAQPDKTLEVALRLQPNTRHVIVEGGAAPYDRHLESLIKQRFHKYESKLEFTYLTDLAMPDLLERLKHLPSNTIVYHTSIMEDAAGTHFIDAVQSAPMVASTANAPVFAVDDVDVGGGTVGGDVFSFDLAGQVAASMAVRILNGEKPQDIPIVRGANVYMFDWRVLHRWGLKENNLPPDSIVLNQQPTVWESYKSYIIGGISLIIVETLLIFGLVWQRARRREAEIQLANSFETVQESERRFRLVANSAPVMIWMSGPDRLCNYFNQPWLDFTGRSLEAELGNGWSEGIHPDDLKDCLDIYMRAFDLRESFKMQYRLRRHDGVYRWVSDIGVPRLNLDGSLAGYIGSCLDVTDHRLAEDALSQMGRRLIEAHEEERTWIARELHDDISQRIALCWRSSWSKVYSGPPSSDVEVPDHITQVCQQLFDLGKGRSRAIAPSKLLTAGNLGNCVSAARRLLQRVIRAKKRWRSNSAMKGYRPACQRRSHFCLFRVLQEALQNAIKHSGERHFRVELLGSSEETQLTVRDSGIGFDSARRHRTSRPGAHQHAGETEIDRRRVFH